MIVKRLQTDKLRLFYFSPTNVSASSIPPLTNFLSRFNHMRHALMLGMLLSTSLPALGQAAQASCNVSTIAGTYYFEETAQSALQVPGKRVAATARAKIAFDGVGNYLINITRHSGGKTGHTTNARGTYTWDGDCHYTGRRVYAEDHQLHVFNVILSNGGNNISIQSNHPNHVSTAVGVRVAP